MSVSLFIALVAASAVAGVLLGVAVRLGRSPRSPARPAAPQPARVTFADDAVPAIGLAAGPNHRELRIRQAVLVAGVLAAAFGLFARQTFQKPPAERIPSVGNVAWVVDGVLMRGAQPRDIDLATLRDLFDVGGVVSLRAPDPVAGLAAGDFSLAFRSVPLKGRVAPTTEQLAEIVRFIRGQQRRGRAVYIYDETGTQHAPTVAAMLLIVRGVPVQNALAAITDDSTQNARYFRSSQLAAINALARRFGDARRLPW